MAILAVLLLVSTLFDQGTALFCYNQICTGANQYCQIQIHNPDTPFCHTANGHHEDRLLCIGAHHPGDHCFCKTQQCVDYMEMNLTTTEAPNTQAPVTQAPVTQAPVTQAPVTQVPIATTAPSTVGPTVCVDKETAFFKCVDYHTQYSICTSLQPSLQAIAKMICPKFCNLCGDGTAPTHSTLTATTVPPSLGPTICQDNESGGFTCADYNNQYGMCTSLTPTLQTIAKTRCPKFCNLCGGGTAPPPSTLSGTTALPPCEDHDPRCAQQIYSTILCNPATAPETKAYAIKSCPKTCNYCTEFYASLTATTVTERPTTTVTQRPTTSVTQATTTIVTQAYDCVDNDRSCSLPEYQAICKDPDPLVVAYNTKTCPYSCNLCQNNVKTTTKPSIVNLTPSLDWLFGK